MNGAQACAQFPERNDLLLCENALAAGNLSLPTRVRLRGHAQRPRKCLKRGFNDVVGVLACKLSDV
jgi:hypothetical protein